MDLETQAFITGFATFVNEHNKDEEFCKKAYEVLTSHEKTAGPLGNIIKGVTNTVGRYGKGVQNTMKAAPTFAAGVKDVAQTAGNKWLGHAQGAVNSAAPVQQRIQSGVKAVAPLAGAAYGAGVAKDYSDMLNQNDEYNMPLSRKLMLGLGLEDKPSMLEPFNPFHKTYDKGVLDQLFGG